MGKIDLFSSAKEEISVFLDEDEDSQVKRFKLQDREKASIQYKKYLITEYKKLKQQDDLYILPKIKVWILEENKSIKKRNIFFLSTDSLYVNVCDKQEPSYEVMNFDESMLIESSALSKEQLFKINKKEFKKLPQAFADLRKRVENLKDVKTCLIWSSFELKVLDLESNFIEVGGINWMEYNFSLDFCMENFMNQYDYSKELVELMC